MMRTVAVETSEHRAAQWVMDVMDGLAAPHDLPDGLDADAAAAADGYRRLFAADFAGALEQVRSVRGGSPYLRAVRRQVEALCTASTAEPLDVGVVDLATVEGAMAVFHTCEAAHVAGELTVCSTTARAALAAGVGDPRAETWVRLALARSLLFAGDVADAGDELGRVVPTTPLATQAVRCLQAQVAGLQGDAAAVVALAEQMRSLITSPSTYADAGLALLGAFGLAAVRLPAAAAELLRYGAGGSNLPLLPVALRAYGYDLLVEAAVEARSLDLAQWLLADFDRLDLGGNAQFVAVRDAARARVRIAEGEVERGLAEATDATQRAVAAGSALIGLRAVLAAAQSGPERLGAEAGDGDRTGRVLALLAQVGRDDLRAWMLRELDARGRRPRPLAGVGWDQLSPAQQVVARLAARGLRNSEIADLLVVSPRTVEVHVAAVLDVLGVGNRVGIVGSAATRSTPDPTLLARLTPRQREVATDVVAGRSNAEIAARLAIGEKAVEKHVTGLMRALGVTSRAAAAARLLGSAADERGAST